MSAMGNHHTCGLLRSRTEAPLGGRQQRPQLQTHVGPGHQTGPHVAELQVLPEMGIAMSRTPSIRDDASSHQDPDSAVGAKAGEGGAGLSGEASLLPLGLLGVPATVAATAATAATAAPAVAAAAAAAPAAGDRLQQFFLVHARRGLHPLLARTFLQLVHGHFGEIAVLLLQLLDSPVTVFGLHVARPVLSLLLPLISHQISIVVIHDRDAVLTPGI